jgi:MoaA/NifB/PqqE/SkfB family radical SAM enzyme
MKLIRVEHSAKRYKDWVRIEWNIGRRCNFDCSYCGYYLHDNKSPHLSLETVENTIKTLREFYSDKKIRISITGGEPFVHPKILDILALFTKYNIDEVCVISNGSLPAAKYIKAMEHIDSIIFSWHFEFLRTEHMKDVIKKVRPLITGKKHMHIHLMFLPGKLQETKEVIDWLGSNEVDYVIRRIRPVRNDETGGLNPTFTSGMKNEGKPIPDATGYYSDAEIEWLDSIQKAGSHTNCELWTKDENWLDNVNTLLKNKLNTFKGWKCMAGLESLSIDNDGSVYRATCKQGGVIGNIETGFQLINEPITCAKQWCNCAADINTTKWKVNE